MYTLSLGAGRGLRFGVPRLKVLSKRKYLAISDKDSEVIQKIADERGTTEVDAIRACIRAGILIYEGWNNGKQVIIRDSESNERIVFLI